MEIKKIGIIREGKVPPDKRVPLSPKQVAAAKVSYPNVEWAVQPSTIRKYTDAEYAKLGISLQEDLSDCDVLFGVKEVPLAMLIPSKTYFFFSHTFKLQPYNAKLLKTILEKKIQLVDYEVIKGANGHRLIGFGRYAGVVGAYNALRAYGVKHNLYDLKPAHLCEDRAEMEAEMDHIKLPENTKIVLTGFGRVGHGALEIMHKLGLKEVEPEAFRLQTFNQPVYCRLDTHEYNARKSDGGYDQSEFYSDPSGYVSTFARFTSVANMYIACHYWGEGSPFLFTREDIKNPAWNVSVVGDISCDIDGPVASTIRSSTIAAPLYGYHRFTEKECDLHNKDAICVMAVDNLPCELPKDASEDFGNELIKHVLPVLLGEDPHNIIGRASETDLNGKLTRHFTYLADYVAKG